MRRLARSTVREKGVTVAEFAIIAPLLFLLIMTIIEGGRIFSTWIIITNEAREGARYGAVRYCNPPCFPGLAEDVRAQVESRIGAMVNPDPSKLLVVVQISESDPKVPTVSVTVDYKVDIVTPLVQNLVPNPFPVRAVSVMRAE